ncbi:MAG TPA: hypothetical protein VM533_10365 [Fimbriiglobus sp.]|jgi:hypothetical protein|nr:hypothetical protein [Fimbriiglobus sp.]
MGRAIYRMWVTVAVVLAGCAAVQSYRTLRDACMPLDGWFEADFLSPAALYEDVVVDGYSLSGYKFSAANFAFPDTAVYFAVRAAVGRPAPAVVVWEAALFVMLVAAGIAAATAVTTPVARRHLVPAVLCAVAAYLGAVAGSFFVGASRDLLLPVCHNGASACGLLGVAMVAWSLRSRSRSGRVGWLLGLAVLAAAATFSDRLFGLYFAAPVAAALLAARALGRPAPDSHLPVTWAGGLAAVAAVGAGCAVGFVTLRLLAGEASDPLQKYWAGPQAGGALARAGRLVELVGAEVRGGNVLVLSAAVWYVGCALAGLAGVTRRLTGRWADATPAHVRAGLTFYRLVSVSALAAVATAFVFSRVSADVLSGSWDHFSRYFVGPMGLAFFGWPIWLAAVVGGSSPVLGRAAAVVGSVALGVAGVGSSLAEPRSSDRDPLDFYPEYVRRLDEECGRRGLRHGLTSYWAAKPINLLSRSGIRVVPVVPKPDMPFGVTAQHWLSNAEWYWKPPLGRSEVRYQFVLAMDLPERGGELAVNNLLPAVGEPADRTPVGQYVLLVYDRPRDRRLARYADLDCSVLNLRHEMDPWTTVRYPGHSYVVPAGRGTAHGDARTVSDGDAPGAVGYGPYLSPRASGRFRVTFRVTSSGTAASNGWVEALFTDPVGKTSTTLAQEVVPPGADSELVLEFEVTRRMLKGLIEFRPVHTGGGELVFHWADFVRLR